MVPKVWLVALVLLGTACNNDKVSALEKRVAALEIENATLKSSQADLKSSISVLQTDKLLRDVSAVAYLTPGGEGYSTVQSDLGPLTVALDNIQPYANGARVTLRFGNLTSASINGLKATVQWGSVDEKGVPKSDGARSRDVTLSRSLNPGSWTTSAVVLDGVPPAELGFVRLRDVTHTGIALNR